jgi:hypothetical protein
MGADPIARALQPSNFDFVIGVIEDARVCAVFFGFVPMAVWGFIGSKLSLGVVVCPLELEPRVLVVSRGIAAEIIGLPGRLVVEKGKVIDISDGVGFRSDGPWEEDNGGVLYA